MWKGISNQQKENKIMKDMIKHIITSDKEKVIVNNTLDLIKSLQTQSFNHDFDTVSLLNKLEQMNDKTLYIKAGIALANAMPYHISIITLKSIIDHIIDLPQVDPLKKVNYFLGLKNSFQKLTQDDIIKMILFIYFDCFLKEDYLSPEVIMVFLTLFHHINSPIRILELTIDTCIIIVLRIKDDKRKQSYYTIIFNLFQYYMTNFNSPKVSLLRNIIHCLLYDYTDLFMNGDMKTCDQLLKFIQSCCQWHFPKTFRIIMNCLEHGKSKTSTAYTYTTIQVFNEEFDIDINEIMMKKYSEFIKVKIIVIESLTQGSLLIVKGSILSLGEFLSDSLMNTYINPISQLVIIQTITKLYTSLQASNHINISYEIMCLLQGFLHKYINKSNGQLNDEWQYIFPLIHCLFTHESDWVKNNDSTIIIKEIIYDLIVLVLNEDLLQHSLLFKQFLININIDLLICDSHILMKIRTVLLLTEKQFQSNYFQIFFGFFFTKAKPHLQINVMEMIRHIYIFNNTPVKAKMIEDHLHDFFYDYIASFKKEKKLYAYFTYFINEILIRSSNCWIIGKIIKKMSMYENEPHYDNNGDDTIYKDFLIETLKDFFMRLQCTYQIDKMKLFLKIFFSSNDVNCNKEDNQDLNDLCLSEISIVFLKELWINKDYEVSSSINPSFKQLVILNYQAILMKEQKLQLSRDTYKQNKANYYAPYTVMNHHHLFNNYISILKTYDNQHDVSTILSFVHDCLQKIYSIKGVCITELLEELLKHDSLIKYMLRKRDYKNMMGIIICIAYHLNTDLIEEQFNHTTILSISSLTLKTTLINNLIMTYDLIITSINKAIKTLRDTQNMIISVFEDQKINKGDITNNIVIINYTYYKCLNQKTGSMKPSFKYSFNIIRKTLKTLQFLLISLIPSIAYFPTSQFHPKSSQSIYKPQNEKIPDNNLLNIIIINLIDDVLLKLSILSYDSSTLISLLEFLLGIKELVCLYDDDLIHKVIFIAVLLGYPQYEDNLDKAYTKCFNKIMNWSKINKDGINTIQMNKIWKDKNIKMYINQLSNIVIIYYLSHVNAIDSMWEVINTVFFSNKKDSKKMNVLREVFHWALYQRGNRDTMKSQYYSNVPKTVNAFIINNKKEIIMICPLDYYQTDIIIRNIISNVSITFHNNNQDGNNRHISENKRQEIMKSLIKCKTKGIEDIIEIENKETEANQLHLNPSMFIEKITNLTKITFSHLEPIPTDSAFLNSISQLDAIPVYNTYLCGILFFPSNALSLYDCLSYTSQVSNDYLIFISSLGQVINLQSTSSLFNVTNINTNNSVDSYVIYYHDILYQLIFHISDTLLPLAEENTSSSIISLRTSILSTNNLIIIWMDNLQSNLDTKDYFNNSPHIFIFIYPISTSHYKIIRKYNANAINNDLQKFINNYMIDEYVINISSKCGIEYFIQSIISINRITEYILSNNKDSLFDNLSLRQDALDNLVNNI